MPGTRWRVVCGLRVTMDSLLPTSAFMSVLLPHVRPADQGHVATAMILGKCFRCEQGGVHRFTMSSNSAYGSVDADEHGAGHDGKADGHFPNVGDDVPEGCIVVVIQPVPGVND